MAEGTKRSIKEGVGFGLIAGVIFAVMEVLGSAILGAFPLAPVRMFASVLLGQEALQMTGGGVFTVGILVHLALAGAFGLVYGLVNSRLSTASQTRWSRQLAIGLAYGALLWLVNFQIIGRIFFPWFLGAPQFLQLVMHAVFFGLPLAIMYGGAERRVHHIGRLPTHA